MRHDGPGLWFTRYTRSQRIPITHAPRVDRFYTRSTAVLAAQAPLVTTFATHFLFAPEVGASVQKIGAWERPRARDARPAIPLSPLPPRTAIHILKRRSEGIARAYHTMYGITIVLRVRERSRQTQSERNSSAAPKGAYF